jgi:hypothetical protein
MDYSKSKIYIIRNKINDKVYVGATSIDPQRCLSKQYEISRQIVRLHLPLSKAFAEIGFENFYIEVIEDHPCASNAELVNVKNHYIDKFDSIRNGYNTPYQTPKKWILS